MSKKKYILLKIFFNFALSRLKISSANTEINPMKSEFQRILREKIRRQVEFSQQDESLVSLDHEPLHLAFLLGTIRKTNFVETQSTPYFRPYPPKKSGLVEDKTQLEPPTPPKHLPSYQQECWLWFWKKGASLSVNFTRSELQKQFRALAQRIHPDKNRHPKAAEAFMLLRERYESLLTHST